MKFYIASKLENFQEVRSVADALVSAGHEHTYDWTAHGCVQGDSMRMGKVAEAEKQGVLEADVLIALLPGGRGTHVEIGMALALDIPVLMVSQDPALFGCEGEICVFYWGEATRRFVGNGRRLPAFLADRLDRMERLERLKKPDTQEPTGMDLIRDASLQRLMGMLFPPVSGGAS